jgi:hypothetical protein
VNAAQVSTVHETASALQLPLLPQATHLPVPPRSHLAEAHWLSAMQVVALPVAILAMHAPLLQYSLAAHCVSSLHGGTPTQVPFEHLSEAVLASPSSHGVPSAFLVVAGHAPVPGSQLLRS